MMPKGVEHADKPQTNQPATGVRIPMMPKGVEHKANTCAAKPRCSTPFGIIVDRTPLIAGAMFASYLTSQARMRLSFPLLSNLLRKGPYYCGVGKHLEAWKAGPVRHRRSSPERLLPFGHISTRMWSGGSRSPVSYFGFTHLLVSHNRQSAQSRR